MKEYKLVINTDSYAGNFEREMCAYVTGEVGECEVGSDQAALFNAAHGDIFHDVVISKPDEHGCWRPVEICDGDINAFEIYLDRPLVREEFMLISTRALEYAQNNNIILKSIQMYEVTITTKTVSIPIEALP